MLKNNDMNCSMSNKGDCWDNSVAESFFGSLKAERVFDSSYSTREEARRDIVDYIEMLYNSRRRHFYLTTSNFNNTHQYFFQCCSRCPS